MAETQLHKAVRQIRSIEPIKKLLAEGINVNAVETIEGKTALHIAAANKNKYKAEVYDEVLKMLVDAGADVNIKDKRLKTALHYAVYNNNFNMVKILISSGSDLNGKDIYEDNVLMLALKKRKQSLDVDYSVINYLLTTHVDVNEASKFIGVPVQYACSNYDRFDTKVIKKLIEKGSDLNVQSPSGYTPLMARLIGRRWCESYEEAKKMLKFLLEHSDVNIVRSNGRNILQMYSGVPSTEIVLQHLAKMRALNLQVDQGVLNVVEENREYRESKSYFEKCEQELLLAKNFKFRNSWVTAFNFLVDDRRKIKNYAGNKDLVDSFGESDILNMFPIYGKSIQENMRKGIKRRKIFDKSTGLLSNYLPIFSPSHLIVRDVLDCIKTIDLSKFCGQNLN